MSSQERAWARVAAENKAASALLEVLRLSDLSPEERNDLWGLLLGALNAFSKQASPWDLLENATKVAKTNAIALMSDD